MPQATDRDHVLGPRLRTRVLRDRRCARVALALRQHVVEREQRIVEVRRRRCVLQRQRAAPARGLLHRADRARRIDAALDHREARQASPGANARFDQLRVRHHAARCGVARAVAADDARGAVAVRVVRVEAHENGIGPIRVRLVETFADLRAHAVPRVARKRLDVVAAALDARVVHVELDARRRIDPQHRVERSDQRELLRREARDHIDRAFVQVGHFAADASDLLCELRAVRLAGEHDVVVADRLRTRLLLNERVQRRIDLIADRNRTDEAHPRRLPDRVDARAIAAHEVRVLGPVAHDLDASGLERTAVLGKDRRARLHEVELRVGLRLQRALPCDRREHRIEHAAAQMEPIVRRGQRQKRAALVAAHARAEFVDAHDGGAGRKRRRLLRSERGEADGERDRLQEWMVHGRYAVRRRTATGEARR